MPMTWPVRVSATLRADQAMPKSVIFTPPSGRTRMLPGLDVAVDHAGAVRHGQREGGLPQERSVVAVSSAALAREQRRQRLALDQLHDQVGERLAGAVLRRGLAVVEDGGGVGVAQRGGVLGLGAEAGDERRVAGVLAAQDLDGDRRCSAMSAPARPGPSRRRRSAGPSS